jgi:hypothetical protein
VFLFSVDLNIYFESFSFRIRYLLFSTALNIGGGKYCWLVTRFSLIVFFYGFAYGSAVVCASGFFITIFFFFSILRWPDEDVLSLLGVGLCDN